MEQKARTSPVKIFIVHPLSMFRATDPELHLAKLENAVGFSELDGIYHAFDDIRIEGDSELREDRLSFLYVSLMKEWVFEEEYLYGNQDIFHRLMHSCGCVVPDKGY